MGEQLKGKRVAVLVANGFEQSELFEPKKALEGAGAKVDVVSPQPGRVRGWNHTEWGQDIGVDKPLDQARPDDYDALLEPLLEGRESFGTRGGGPAGVRRGCPRAVDVVSAAAGADGERLPGELPAELRGAGAPTSAASWRASRIRRPV